MMCEKASSKHRQEFKSLVMVQLATTSPHSHVCNSQQLKESLPSHHTPVQRFRFNSLIEIQAAHVNICLAFDLYSDFFM